MAYNFEAALANIEKQRNGQPPEPTPPVTAPNSTALDTLGLNLQRAATANPQDEAKRRKLAGELKIPQAILPPTPDAESQAFLKNARAQEIMRRYPALANWAQNPDNAAVAGKDLVSLGDIEKTASSLPKIAQFGKNLAGSAAAAFPSANAAIWSFVQAAGAILSTNATKPLSETIGTPDVGEMLRTTALDMRKRASTIASDLAPDTAGMGTVERGINSGVQSAATSLMMLPLSVATGSPTPMLAGLSAITAGQSLGEATDKGLPLNEALIHATKQGVIEYATELFPVGNLLKNLTMKTGLVRTATEFMIREGIGEQAATVLQDLDKWATLNPDKPFSEYLAERPEAALETLIATAVGGSIQVGGAKMVAKGLETLQRSTTVDLGRAQRAEENHGIIQGLGEQAAKHPLRERDPSAFHDFMSTMTEDGNLSDVFVDGKVLGDVLNQSGVNMLELGKKMPEVAQQLAEAQKTNGEVRISLADYATYVAGTDVEKGIIDHLRASPDGMTYNEAQQFYQSQKEDLSKQAETLMSDANTTEEYKADVQQVHDTILEGMNKAGRFTPAVNAAYAVPFREFYAVQAAKMGMLPSELYRQMPLNFAGIGGGNTLQQSVFHGTPHVWAPEPGFPHGRPRLDKMGTGEGAQAFGWGWYSAENKGVAKEYHEKLTPTAARADHFIEQFGGLDEAIAGLETRLSNYQSMPQSDKRDSFIAIVKENLEQLGRRKRGEPENEGSLYSLDIPDSVLPHLLDWDKPLGEQTPEVREAIGKISKGRMYDLGISENFTDLDTGKPITGGDLVKYVGAQYGQKAGSEYLASIGIVGNRYLDGGSRADGKGTYNYVIWDQPTLDKVALLERNGEKLDAIRELAQSAQQPDFDALYPVAGDTVDGRTVRDDVPNQSSIDSSIDNPEILSGIREVSFAQFDQMGPLKYHSVSEEERTKNLAEKILASGEIAPLIVVIDEQGPYVLEGGHRFDALRELGAKSFPAMVVLDLDALEAAGQVTLNQENRAGYNPDTFTISLLKGADLSSTLHEGGHFYLEALADLAARPEAPQQIKDDFRKTLDWFGITGNENLGEGTRGGDLGQSPLNENFKVWSNNAPLITSAQAETHQFKTGEKIVVEAFHGTGRPDRVGDKFLKKRATSGPMAYHTSSPALASNYASGKMDTSLANEDQDYANWFKVKVPGSRNPVDIVRAWYSLDSETKQRISEIAPTLRLDDDVENVIAEEGNTSGNGSYDYNLQQTQKSYDRRGNPLRALVEDWLSSGTLFNNEELFMRVLKEAGMPMRDVTYDSPHSSFPFVYKNYIAMQSPLVTSDIPASVGEALNAAAKRDRSRAKLGGADAWDKNNRTMRDWVEEFNNVNGKESHVWTSIPDKVTEVLKSLGYDGIVDWSGKNKGGGVVAPVYIPFEETQVKSALGNKGKFNTSKNNILNQGGDPGTPGNLPPGRTPEEVWAAMSLDQKRPYHEQWAQSFERYMLEGKAPTTEMQPIFARFRAWMLNVYKSLENFLKNNPLAGKLNDEVRGIFDRLIAAEESIKATESVRAYAPLFENNEAAGVTPKRFQEYLDIGEAATQQAIDDLAARSLRDMKWLSNAKEKAIKELQKEAKAKRKVVEEQVKTEVMSEPVNQARTFLKTGEMTDPATGDQIKAEAGFKIDKEAVAALFPKGGTVTLDSAKLRGMTSEDGLSPELAAQMFGFPSGEALVLELVNGESAKEKIEAMTDQRMLEQYGELSSEEDIERAAEAAIHNEARARFLATGLAMLSKSPIPANQLSKAAKQAAEATIASRKVRDLRPAQYERAETKANKEAIALAPKDPQGAVQAQRAALLNNRLAKVSADAVKEVEKILRYVGKFQSEGTRKALDLEYLEQIDDLLRPFDFRKGQTLRQIDKNQSLADWIDAQEAQGFEPAIDAALMDQAKLKSYKNMTMEELRGLIDSVKQIEHLGRLKNKLLLAKDERAFNAVVAEGVDSIEKNANRTVEERGTPTDAIGIAGKWWRQMTADHRKFASIMREMDGGKDNGFMFNHFLKFMNQAGDNETQMKAEATDKLAALFKKIKKDPVPGNIYAKKRVVPGTNLSMTHEQRIMFAMNWGNEGNRQRLLDGGITGTRALSIGQAEAILDTLTQEEWDFVQGVWDFIGEYKPQVAALERRLTGIEPVWIDPAPVKTKYGTYRGGYFPVKYDTELSSRSESLEAATDLRMGMKGAFNSAATRSGFTKMRADQVVNRPILLSYNAISQHVSEVTHRLAWQEWLVDSNRLLKALDNPIRAHYGAEILRTLRDTVVDIAAGDAPAKNGTETAINRLRVGSTVVGMGWRVTTALLQPSGLAQSWARIGGRHIARGVYQFTKSPITSGEFVNSKSKMMVARGKTMQREINEVLNTIRAGDKVSAFKASYFSLIGKMQRTVDIPTWLGAYDKATEELKLQNATTKEERVAIEEQAAALADQAVLDSQSGGQLKDLAKVQRGGPLQKIFTNFYSYFSATYNLNVEAVRRTNFKSPSQVALLATDMVLLNSVPVLFSVALKELLKGECGDDLECLGEKLGHEQLNFLLGQMILLREAGVAIDTAAGGQGFGYQGPAGLRFFSDLYKLGQQTDQGEADIAFFKAANQVAGALLHYPAGQINATMEGIIAIEEGKVEGMGILPALISGPPKK